MKNFVSGPCVTRESIMKLLAALVLIVALVIVGLLVWTPSALSAFVANYERWILGSVGILILVGLIASLV